MKFQGILWKAVFAIASIQSVLSNIGFTNAILPGETQYKAKKANLFVVILLPYQGCFVAHPLKSMYLPVTDQGDCRTVHMPQATTWNLAGEVFHKYYLGLRSLWKSPLILR